MRIQENGAGSGGGSRHQHHLPPHVRCIPAAAESAPGGYVGRMTPRRRRRDRASGVAVACVCLTKTSLRRARGIAIGLRAVLRSQSQGRNGRAEADSPKKCSSARKSCMSQGLRPACAPGLFSLACPDVLSRTTADDAHVGLPEKDDLCACAPVRTQKLRPQHVSATVV